MATLTYGLITLGAWWVVRGKPWAHWVMLAALVCGAITFLSDVDLADPLGARF